MGIRVVTGYPLTRRARTLDLRRRPRSGADPLHLRGDELGSAVVAD